MNIEILVLHSIQTFIFRDRETWKHM